MKMLIVPVEKGVGKPGYPGGARPCRGRSALWPGRRLTFAGGRALCWLFAAAFVFSGSAASAQETAPTQLASVKANSAPAEAWWTGPMLANSAATMPKGHALVETYVYEQIEDGARLHGSLTYLLYGVTDRLTLGTRPIFGATSVGGRTSALGLGDLTVLAQYRLTSPGASWREPTVAVSLQYSVPLGRYDQLDTRPAAALGSGAPSSTIALYVQQYFKMANGRPLRLRVNIAATLAGSTKLAGASVYGTSAGFRGRGSPGGGYSVGLASEYSMKKRWVLALDAVYDRTGSSLIRGEYPRAGAASDPISVQRPGSAAFALAPAVEYSLRENLGFLVGARFRLRGRNAASTVTPAIAINYSY